MKLLCVICLISFALALLNCPSCLHRYRAWYYGGEYLGNEGVRFQSEQNNCGPASLAMVYDAYGIGVSEGEIEHSVEMTPRGTTMLALNDQAEKSGLSASGWRLTMEELRRSKFPSILFVRGDHFIVADSVREENVYLRDPAIGRLKISEKSLARIWRGETLVFRRK